jgi:hypothetical protein
LKWSDAFLIKANGGYTLPLPISNTAEYEHAQHLAPQHNSCRPSVRYTTPVRGNFRTVLDLDDDVGVPAEIFWRMFVLCRGCDRVMAGRYLKDHTCDLTHL